MFADDDDDDDDGGARGTGEAETDGLAGEITCGVFGGEDGEPERPFIKASRYEG